MPKASRDKGARREREAAALVREWVGPEYEVARNARNAQKGAETAGDLSVEGGPQRFLYCIEVKGHAAFSPAELWLEDGGSRFAKWADQALEQAQACRRAAMLMVKPDRRPWLVALPARETTFRPKPYMRVDVHGTAWVVMLWDTWAGSLAAAGRNDDVD